MELNCMLYKRTIIRIHVMEINAKEILITKIALRNAIKYCNH